MNTLQKLNYLANKKIKWGIFRVLILIMLGSIAELMGVAVILPVVNLAIDANYQENFWCKLVINLTGFDSREKVLLVMVGATILIYIAKSVYLSWMYSRLYRFSAYVKREMAVKLMQAYLKQPYSYFLQKNTSELIRSVNSDTAQLYEIVLNCLLVVSNGLTALALVITLFITNPIMTVTIVVLLGICALVIILGVQKKTRYFGKRNQELSAFLIKYLQQTFEGIKEIKISNRENYFIDQYSGTYKEQTDIARRYSLVNLIPKYMIELVSMSGIMAYLGVNILVNPNYMDIIPQLAVFVAAAYKLLPSVNALYAYLNTIIYHRASIDLIYHDVKEANELETQEQFWDDHIETLHFEQEIEASNVTFAYGDSAKNVLQDVNFVIPKGKSVAFVGPSGGGKTTTADIIIGLLAPVKGEICVDRKSIKEHMESWRRNIGYIPQSIYLTDGSIKSNIALGVPEKDIDEDKVWKALEQAQLSDFVHSLERGLETEVGERGTRISGGQKQRIGIARALYREPEVLVFDEATSALDNETEKEVMKAIESLHGNKTMIMIAHRLSTIENCDIVYRVENGKIIRER